MTITASDFEIGTRTFARLIGVEDAESLPVVSDLEAVKFCGQCGAELVETRGPGGYNTRTGLPFGIGWKRCPDTHETYLGWWLGEQREPPGEPR